MPCKAIVNNLRIIIVNDLAETIHRYSKVCSKLIRENKRTSSREKNSQALKDVQKKVEECFRFFSEIGVCIYHSSSELEDTFQCRMRNLILEEPGLLDETYYLGIGRATFNGTLRTLSLDNPRTFQDSSFALEIFLFFYENDSTDNGLFLATRLQEFTITKSVCELIDFDFDPVLRKLGGSTYMSMNKLVLQGLNEIGTAQQTLMDFAKSLLKKYHVNDGVIPNENENCQAKNDTKDKHGETKNSNTGIERLYSTKRHLSFLDLSHSPIDDECCHILAQINALTTVIVNNCVNVTTIGILDFLENLQLLERIEANKGQNSTVQQAFAILDSEGRSNTEATTEGKDTKSSKLTEFPKLKNFMFRNPRSGIDTVSWLCPNVDKIRILYNVYEYSYDARLDDCLIELTNFKQFKENLDTFNVHLDLNCMNMLFVIQLQDLMKYGKSITKITLNEAEFVHPQTLNPLALKCPRLKSLTLFNPSTISDNLFVGEVPELMNTPFKNLHNLVFEGESLSVQLGEFLFKSAINYLETINLAVEEYTPEFKEILRFFIIHPRPRLKCISLYFGSFGSTTSLTEVGDDAHSESKQFAEAVSEVVEHSPNLNKLNLFIRKSYIKGLENVVREQISLKQKSYNWDICYSIVIK